MEQATPKTEYDKREEKPGREERQWRDERQWSGTMERECQRPR